MKGVAVFGVCAVVAVLAVCQTQTFDARTQPGPIETRVARTLRNWSVPLRYRKLANPVACSSDTLDRARAHWADHCAVCHANNGSGSTLFGLGLNPPPPDLRSGPTRAQSDGEIYHAIKNGIRFTGMPAFGAPGDADVETWALVCFVRHLPSMTADEELSMRALNPKTPADLEEERLEDEYLNGGASGEPAHHHHTPQVSR